MSSKRKCLLSDIARCRLNLCLVRVYIDFAVSKLLQNNASVLLTSFRLRLVDVRQDTGSIASTLVARRPVPVIRTLRLPFPSHTLNAWYTTACLQIALHYGTKHLEPASKATNILWGQKASTNCVVILTGSYCSFKSNKYTMMSKKQAK